MCKLILLVKKSTRALFCGLLFLGRSSILFSVAFTNRWQFPTHDSRSSEARLEKLFYPSMHLLIGLISGAELDFHMIGFTAERVYG